MADVDWGQVEQQLKSKAGQWYDSSMLGDVQRNTSYNAAGGVNDLDSWVDRISNKAKLRGSNEVNSTYQANQRGGVTVGPTGKVNDPNGTGGGMSTSDGGGGGGSNAAWSQAPGPTIDPELKNKQDQLYNMLMSRATQGTNVDRNTPAIRMQADAFNANVERNRRNYLSDVAESSGPYANLTGERRMATERAGIASGQNEASLVGRELTAKRDEIAQALASAQGMLTESQRLDLQRQLAVMNQAIQNRGLSLQEKAQGQTYDLGLRGLGLNDWGQQMYWDAVNSGRMG